MDPEIEKTLLEPDWFEKYHNYVTLHGKIAYAKELLMDYCWVSDKYLRATYWWGRVPPHKAPSGTDAYLQKGMWK